MKQPKPDSDSRRPERESDRRPSGKSLRDLLPPGTPHVSAKGPMASPEFKEFVEGLDPGTLKVTFPEKAAEAPPAPEPPSPPIPKHLIH